MEPTNQMFYEWQAKPNLESRIKTLKRDWAIVYDMLSGKDNSD
ncbi:hypothetical protein Godav_001402, partial [Gossypium davidsonii]|nr:hypothetical protein [Gossypium davidsonii]